MQPHSNYPELAGLEKLVHEHRRKVAGEIRIVRERRALEQQIEESLRGAGVEAVSCRLPSLGLFEVRRAVTRDGRHYASVAPVDAKAARESPPYVDSPRRKK